MPRLTQSMKAEAIRTELQAGIGCAQEVIDNWGRGDLAGAVFRLYEWIKAAKQTLKEHQEDNN